MGKKITLRAKNEMRITNYLTSVLQGDCLSLLLFILSVTPLSFLLKNLPGYKIGEPGERGMSFSYLFIVDGLRTYAADKKRCEITP